MFFRCINKQSSQTSTAILLSFLVSLLVFNDYIIITTLYTRGLRIKIDMLYQQLDLSKQVFIALFTLNILWSYRLFGHNKSGLNKTKKLGKVSKN